MLDKPTFEPFCKGEMKRDISISYRSFQKAWMRASDNAWWIGVLGDGREETREARRENE
jgi:hypothetical protein